MAGPAVPMIHCWRLRVGRLSVSVASSTLGAKRIELSLDSQTPVLELFRPLFPGSTLILSRDWNEPLIVAVEASLAGDSPSASLQTDIAPTPFQNAVLRAISRIPFGSTLSYSEVAATLGNPSLARAVGQALKRNPLPIVFPCHRVLAANGLGGFGGRSPANLAIKRFLLEREGSLETA